MPALVPTEHIEEIAWLGRVPRRDAPKISTIRLDEMALSFAGAEGEVHAGLTRPSCSRVLSQYPRDTEIRNTRQVSIVSAEEMEDIFAEIGLEILEPAWLGETLRLHIPDQRAWAP